jgi:hypothetical protein
LLSESGQGFEKKKFLKEKGYLPLVSVPPKGMNTLRDVQSEVESS